MVVLGRKSFICYNAKSSLLFLLLVLFIVLMENSDQMADRHMVGHNGWLAWTTSGIILVSGPPLLFVECALKHFNWIFRYSIKIAQMMFWRYVQGLWKKFHNFDSSLIEIVIDMTRDFLRWKSDIFELHWKWLYLFQSWIKGCEYRY